MGLRDLNEEEAIGGRDSKMGDRRRSLGNRNPVCQGGGGREKK